MSDSTPTFLNFKFYNTQKDYKTKMLIITKTYIKSHGIRTHELLSIYSFYRLLTNLTDH